MSFGKAFLSSCLGAFVALIFFALFGFIFFSAIIGGLTAEKEVVVKNNSVLHLRLDAEFTELQRENPLEGLPVVGQEVPEIGLLQLKESIAHAAEDEKIQGILVDVGFPRTGFSTLEEIRQSLLEFRKSGKWVVAYSEVMSEGAYYVATAANQVYLNPEGEVEFNGLTGSAIFFKKLLDKLEIKPQVFRVGEFKSAVEPFTLEKMSPENRLQLTEIVNSIYDYVIQRVSEARGIPEDKLREISDKMLVRNAREAHEAGLVDSLFYKDELENNLRDRLGLGDNDKINFIKYMRYRKSFSTYKSTPNEIAVIVAEGPIVPGTDDGSQRVIAAETYVEEIKRARKDDDVKAIVLRVNSPGGEVRSSDMIWREIELAKQVKPVVASMSDYAASGGYYIAMGCDTIVAQPHTVTGSIGIFGIIMDMSSFLGDKLGITFDEVRTGEFGDTYTVTRPLNAAEKRYVQKMLDEFYETFTRKAADGREVSIDEIQMVASGRVWTGAQALDRKLVDVLGGVNDAIRIAAEMAGVSDDYRVRYFPVQKPFIQQLLTTLEENAAADRVKAELGDLGVYYEQVKKIQHYQGAQARLPFEIEIN